MGDYTLVGMHFTLKKDTPQEVLDAICRRIDLQPLNENDPPFLTNIFHCTSAYHHVKNFLDVQEMFDNYEGHSEGFRINTVFQSKYGRGIHEFVNWISPYVITDECNKGCVGWKLSEYCSSPSYLFVHQQDEDPKVQYIRELELKLHNILRDQK